MPDMVRDGRGKGYLAGVDYKNRILVNSLSKPIQFATSYEQGQAYQLWCITNVSPGRNVGLYVQNNDPLRDLVVTYIRHQVIGLSGGTTLPNVNNYFAMSFNPILGVNGDVLRAKNMNPGSGNDAIITSFGSGTTVTGGTEFERWFTKDMGDMNTYNKEGALILGYGNSMDLSYFSDHAAGTFYFRLSFIMVGGV